MPIHVYAYVYACMYVLVYVRTYGCVCSLYLYCYTFILNKFPLVCEVTLCGPLSAQYRRYIFISVHVHALAHLYISYVSEEYG